MASRGKQRKQKNLERRDRLATGPPRPPKDGDRRRKEFGAMARIVLKQKELERETGLDALIDLIAGVDPGLSRGSGTSSPGEGRGGHGLRRT